MNDKVVHREDLGNMGFCNTGFGLGKHLFNTSKSKTLTNPGIYGISLDTTAISFTAVDPGYRAPTSRTIRVTNTGNQPTGALTLSLSGTNAASFTLSRTSLTSIAVGGSATFTVVPRTGLAAGSYEASVTVRGANGITESFPVRFIVR